MDFQTLARRDLQALCKRNKIPANMTNLAMAEALQALDLVEGIDEVMLQPSQSGTAQSSSESFDMGDVTSPFVSQTAGRSTRRANIPKPATESVNPATRTRRTTRKTQVKDADAVETPAPMSQANRKNVQTASACLNMDSQLMECEDLDTKDALATPAPIGATARRSSRVDDSAAKRVYSTRRSARLAVKSNVETSTDKDGVDSFSELSGFSDESEVVSTGKEESEVVSDQKNDATIGEEINLGSYAVEETKLGKEKRDYEEEMPLNVSNEVQQKNGSQDECIPEIEAAVEKSIEELKPEEGESSEVQQDFVDNVILESGDNIVADGKTGFNDEIMEELNNGIGMDGGSRGVTELTLQQSTEEAYSEYVDSLDIIVQLNENEANKVESLKLEEIEKAAAAAAAEPVESDEPFADLSEQLPKSDFEVLKNEPAEIEVLPLEDTDMSAEQEPSENIESGTKMVVMRDDDDVKMAEKNVDDELCDMSIRKLTKLLKEKLEITKIPSKNENDNKATSRTALQVISENRMVE